MSDFYLIVAEDDPFYNKIYKSELKLAGINHVVVENGVQAIEEIKKQKPTLLLLDLIMPEKDGFEVLEELQAMDGYEDMSIIVMSNLGQDEDVARAKELGAKDYFVKANISLPELLDKIRSYT
ncbi:response regulator [Candidatus Peregrinibacteria bacterium]|jgi:two-component system, OmpR family, alkaline phosphatase synthesis response regulator PhoP|nr:response regulator [Candidatus Peregrinibacteria bacterium]MBT4632210.1 response regulator [Candidatus Peregrinibacteria bacterium]MBT5516315.1 response regulator [Candidatus Peregrinibacteria bacterium]MBT5824379.1 response regulator [Candidatus Peregrinibacteria bacterium]